MSTEMLERQYTEAEIEAGAHELASQAQALAVGGEVTLYFSYSTYNLGSAKAVEDFRGCNFDAAGVWIK